MAKEGARPISQEETLTNKTISPDILAIVRIALAGSEHDVQQNWCKNSQLMWRFLDETVLGAGVEFDPFWREQTYSTGMAFDNTAFDAFCRDLVFSSPLSVEKQQEIMEIEKDAVSDLPEGVKARLFSSDPSMIPLYKGVANMAERTYWRKRSVP